MRYRELLKVVKELIEEHYCIMLHWDKNGDLCLLYKHWMYENALNGAKRVYLGNYEMPEKFHQSPKNTFYIYSVDHFKEQLKQHYRKKLKR